MKQMSCREALLILADRAVDIQGELVKFGDPVDKELAAAQMVLAQILEQEGCEHFDPGVSDGRLTSLMDIVIFG